MKDLMNITVETGDAFLDKKLNSHICYGGGDGPSTTQSSDIPDWLKPHAQKFLGAAGRGFDAGALSKVAGETAQQQEAYDVGTAAGRQQTQLGQQAAQRAGQLYDRPGVDTDRLRSDFLAQARRGAGEAGAQADAGATARGTYGGARSRMAREAGRAQAQEQAALGFTQAAQQAQQQDFANKANLLGQTSALQAGLGTGAQTLAGVGKERQAQQQKLADAQFQGLQRFGQLLGVSGGFGQDKIQTQGGGK